VVFLASPESGWITAQVLTVDGGRMDYWTRLDRALSKLACDVQSRVVLICRPISSAHCNLGGSTRSIRLDRIQVRSTCFSSSKDHPEGRQGAPIPDVTPVGGPIFVCYPFLFTAGGTPAPQIGFPVGAIQ
jgi:hypothetical protein